MPERRYDRIYDWGELQSMATPRRKTRELTDAQAQWCNNIRNAHRENPRFVLAADQARSFPGAIAVFINPDVDVDTDRKAFPDFALVGTPDCIEVVYVRMPPS